ncbi:hypothetical protein GCM10027456_65950 [Kineosporia babensis]
MLTDARHLPSLPRTYYLWLGGAMASLIGDSMLYFALAWAATAHGGAVAGLVLTAINLPRVMLLLVGGALGDRLGARRVMIAGDSVMLVASVLLAALAYHLGAEPWLLIGVGVVIGTVDAFYLPASGSMPRRLVGPAGLPRALALRQSGSQLISMGAGPLGGILVGAAGLAGTALVNAVTFALVLVILIVVRPNQELPPAHARQPVLREAADGIRLGVADPILRPALLLVGAAAGFLLPIMSLLLPLLARQHDWSATATGLVVGAQGLGMVAVTLTVVRRGQFSRPGLVACRGLLLAGLGIGALTAAPGPGAALAAGLLIGVGNGLFASHIAPLIMTVTPQSHLSRIQALLTLVQSLPLLLMNNVLGNLATFTGPALTLFICCIAVIATGLAALTSEPLTRLSASRADQ